MALSLLFTVFASTPSSHDLCDLLGLETTSRALSGPGLIICYICKHPKQPRLVRLVRIKKNKSLLFLNQLVAVVALFAYFTSLLILHKGCTRSPHASFRALPLLYYARVNWSDRGNPFLNNLFLCLNSQCRISMKIWSPDPFCDHVS